MTDVTSATITGAVTFGSAGAQAADAAGKVYLRASPCRGGDSLSYLAKIGL